MRFIIIFLSALVVCTANAQSDVKKIKKDKPAEINKKSGWVKEPNGFVGVNLNEPLRVEACPTEMNALLRREVIDFDAMKLVDGVCVDTTEGLQKSGIFRLRNLPDIGIGYTVRAIETNGVISRITIDLKQSDFGTLLELFKTRYGAPTSVEDRKVKTQAGAQFNATEVSWIGKKLSIHMYERLSRVDESYVSISDNVATEKELSEKRERRSIEALKF